MDHDETLGKRPAQGSVAGRLGGALLCLLVTAVPGIGVEAKSYEDVLQHLTDLDRLTVIQTGCRGGLFSSWDRRSHTQWGANGDVGQYLRVEPNGEAVMMDLEGPGVVYRIWSANPMGKIRVYLDGATTPSFEWNFPDLFDGQLYPFIKPLVYRRDNPQSASDCYLPIPFARHIKITADKPHGEYYHFNYVTFPKDQPVASFRLPLSESERQALEKVADVWSHPGLDPKAPLPGTKTFKKTVSIAPGETVKVWSAGQGGVVRAVRAKVGSTQRYAWRKVILTGVWDRSDWPQIHTPLGPFFGFDFEPAEYGSVPAGCQKGQGYQFFPMPFKESAEFKLQNLLEAPATVELQVDWAPRAEWSEDTLYFYARWRHESDLVRFDYPLLETAGRGHFVGVSLPIEHPLEGWWGEGDEMIWVDDDDFPPYIGTGSEDYFGDAWGIRYLSGPSYGASASVDGRTCNYRWHFTDLVPFNKRMRMTIENYGPNGVGPRGQYDYSSTTFWYQAEKTPAFEQLRRVTFTGGSEPADPPRRMRYQTNIFSAITQDDTRTIGLGLIFAHQAEVLLRNEVNAGRAKRVTDAKREYEFDREQAVSFGQVKKGAHVAEFTIEVSTNGVYLPHLHTAPEKGAAPLGLSAAGKALAVIGRPSGSETELEGVYLTGGAHVFKLTAAGDGEAIFDALQLLPAKRFTDAFEAEEMVIVQPLEKGSAPKASDPIPGVSAGRVLEFKASKAGEGFTVKLDQRPSNPYVLGVRPMLCPNGGIIQAFAGGRAIGPTFDLYAEKRELGPSILPLGPVPAGAKEIEIRVVNRRAASKGWEASLDYFRWEPDILGPGTAPGVWAQVIGKSKCDYRGQDLGVSYSGGHQFWVIPSELKSWIDVALEIPKAGTYELTAKYTKSWDYGIIQAFLDNEPLGPAVDTYAATVLPGEPTRLGKVELSAGRHVLRFQVVGQHPQSKGYLMGIDHVVVKE